MTIPSTGRIPTIPAALDRGFDGVVHHPGTPGYERERVSWHRQIDPRPALVVEAETVADVRTAVLTAREHSVPFAVQSTGHGTVSPVDDGLLLKTSRLTGVTIDPARRTARVGPGTVWSEVIAAAARFGLAPISGTPSVGVTGYTLGGGLGWLSRLHGFAADSVVRVELVTADGASVIASAGENPELFWAVRGGGGGFGVVTALEFRLYPLDTTFGGMRVYPAHDAAAALARYADWVVDVPDSLTTALSIARMPDAPHVPEPVRGRPVLSVRTVHAGDGDEAFRLLQPLLGPLGEPVIDTFAERTFADVSAITGPDHPPVAVRQHFDMFHDLTPDVVEILLEPMGHPSPIAGIEVRHWGGAMARPAPDAGPAGHRDVQFSAAAAAMWDDDEGRRTAENAMDEFAHRLRPHATGATFLNFLTDTRLTATAFTDQNYRRLRQVKRAWDPDAVFRTGHVIPAEPRQAGSGHRAQDGDVL